MNNKLLISIVTATSIAAIAASAMATPLPAGTKLTIIKSTDGALVQSTPCPNGSCFGMFLFAGLYAWTPLGPGTDGGLIIGKAQRSGGQEVNGLLCLPGEMTDSWSYGSNCGTFFTTPSDAGNVFDDQSCTGSACGSHTTPRKTDLAVWNTAWGGQTIPMGSANGCNPAVTPACTADQIAGIFVNSWTIDPAGTVPRKYTLLYDQVVSTVFPNFPFKLALRGTLPGGDCFNIVTVTPNNITGVYGVPIPFTITVAGCVTAPTCRVGTPPTNGAVILNGCTSGTYTSDVGFVGTNSFTLIANDGLSDSMPALVNVAITAPTATPIFTPTLTTTPAPTPSPSPLCTPNPPPPTLSLTTTSGQPVSWDTSIYGITNCTLVQAPNHGTVTVTGCSGAYTPNSGFVGRDSFIYYGLSNNGSCPAYSQGTVYIEVCPAGGCASPTPTVTPTPVCTDQYPLRQTTLTGKQGHLSITVTGNLVSVNPNGKEIKICPTTTASYSASTNTPGATVVCKVKSNTGRGQGHVKVNDHIKCTDKPIGNDKLSIKIKSGVNQKVM